MDEIKNTSSPWYDVTAILLPLIILCVLFPKIITAPNDILFSTDGDGLKNIFTPAYYVHNDSGSHFSGMNYPYGEVVTFTDNQPIISYILQKVNSILPISENIFGILNWLMMIGIILGVFFMYKIFLFYGVPPIFSIWCALIVVGLSPQLNRIDVHFALGYIFFFPLSWYIHIRSMNSNSSYKWNIFQIINIVFQSLVHLYFLIINGVFILAYSLVQYFTSEKNTPTLRTKSVKSIAIFFISAIIVLAIVKGIDPINDRPEDPYGLESYTTSIKCLFLPNKGIVNTWIKPKNIVGEGEAYIGILGIPFFFFTIFLFYKYLKNGPLAFVQFIRHRSLLFTSVIAGIISFFYSAGYLNTLGLKYLNEIVPTLNQFRSLGRISWIPYFIFITAMLIISVSYWKKGRQKSSFNFFTVFPILALIIWTWEAGVYFHFHTHDLIKENIITSNSEVESLEKLLDEKDMKFSEFQAILGLPITILGPEKLQIRRGFWNMKTTMPLALNKKLPLIDIAMSRTSVSQALELLELFTPDYVPKKRLELMNDLPILVMHDRPICVEYENNLVVNKHFIGGSLSKNWFSIHKNDLYNPDKNRKLIDHFSDTIGVLHHANYNSEGGPSFAGSGSKLITSRESTIWSGSIPTGRIFKLVFWIKLDHQTPCLPAILFEKTSREGDVLFSSRYDFNAEATAQNGWLQVHWRFDTEGENDIFYIKASGCTYRIDEVVIWEESNNIYTRSGDHILFNNYRLN